MTKVSIIRIRILECPESFQLVFIRGVEKKSADTAVRLAINEQRTIVHEWLLILWLVAHSFIKHFLSVLLDGTLANFWILALICQDPILVQ